MRIKSPDIKILYSRSAGKCNICGLDITEDDIHIGEMAHVIARKQNGPRGISTKYPEINSYENLILLCPNHHEIVDKNPEKYTVEYLLTIKKNHEDFINTRLDISKNYLDDLDSLKTLLRYIPITQYISQLDDLPFKFRMSTELSDPVDMYRCFITDNPHAFPFNDITLQEKWNTFLDYYNAINDWLGGLVQGNRLVTINDSCNYTERDNSFIHTPSVNPYISICYGNEMAMIKNKSELSDEQSTLVDNEVTILKNNAIQACYELINYIRINFQDIKLN